MKLPILLKYLQSTESIVGGPNFCTIENNFLIKWQKKLRANEDCRKFRDCNEIAKPPKLYAVISATESIVRGPNFFTIENNFLMKWQKIASYK